MSNAVSTRQQPHLRLYLTALAALAELAHLAWEHFHGGIVSHHFLRRADMPAISNAWGIVLIPALTWFAIGRVQARVSAQRDAPVAAVGASWRSLIGFAIALLLGAALAAAFTLGYEAVTSNLFMSLLLLALLFRAYHAECVLGFVLGMTLTFGAVLPTLVAMVIAVLSAVVHLGIRPLLVGAWKRLRRNQAGPLRS